MKRSLLKPLDVLITILVGAAIAAISVKAYDVDERPVAVSVKSQSGLSMYPLSENRRLEIPGPLGITVVAITDKQVRVLSSPCRDKLCMNKGILQKNGDWTACMPNLIYVGIKGRSKEELDELSY